MFELVYNHTQSIWDKIWFSCEITHYKKSSISVLQETFASTDKISISEEGLATRQ